MFIQDDIDELSIIIYNRDRVAINVLEAIFLAVESILYIQYIDTAVKAQAYKIFRQQKSKDSIRYVASELASEFLILYRIYRFAKTEKQFDEAYATILDRAIYDDTSDDTSDNQSDNNDNDIDKIARPLTIDKRVGSYTITNKDILTRQLKALRYLENYQQVYKEKYVRAQTDKLRYFGFDVLLVGKGAYIGLKKQTTSTRNNILMFILKLYLFFDGYRDRYKYTLTKVQNTLSTRFVNRPQFQAINTIIDVRGLKYIDKQRQRLKEERKKLRINRNYQRSEYIGVFKRTIGIDYLYILDDVQAIRPYLFDNFQRIPDTVTRLERAQRLLELLPRNKYRSARIQRSYTTSIGVLTSQRDPLLIERLNPNNRNATPLGKANNTVLARRNGEPQRLIQEQPRRRVATNSSTVRYNCTI